MQISTCWILDGKSWAVAFDDDGGMIVMYTTDYWPARTAASIYHRRHQNIRIHGSGHQGHVCARRRFDRGCRWVRHVSCRHVHTAHARTRAVSTAISFGVNEAYLKFICEAPHSFSSPYFSTANSAAWLLYIATIRCRKFSVCGLFLSAIGVWGMTQGVL